MTKAKMPAAKVEKIGIKIMMPVDMRHKLKIVAAHEDVSFVKLIIKILDGHLERNKNGN